MKDDLELTVLSAVVELLSREGIDDTQRQRILRYATARCIKPEPPREYGIQASAYAQHLGQQNYKGVG